MDNSIGILDSGVGGLTVWRAITTELPNESVIYVGDSKNAPYGEKDSLEIYFLAKSLVQFLISQNVKIVVIACNTITVSCLDKLRIQFPQVPIIGTVPVIKTAAEVSRNKKIGIFSTTRTAESEYQKKLLERFAKNCEVISLGSDRIVPLIEQGQIDTKEMKGILEEILVPFKINSVDTVCLGCTHFPFIKEEIKEVLGGDVLLLEPSSAIARHVKNILGNNKQLAYPKGSVKYKFYTTGDEGVFVRVAKSLLKIKIQAQGIDL